MPFTLRHRLAQGETIFAAWIASQTPRNAEIAVSAGFDAAVFDLQHSESTIVETRDGIAAVRLQGKPSAVRVGLDGFAEAARCLDLGAEIVIMPMINNVADARRFVDTVKYPPVGGRSWGPARAFGLLGMDANSYRLGANEGTVALAMIETRTAVESLDAILDVEGLDGVFVGPSDLAISMSNGATRDDSLPEALAAITQVIEGARKRGKFTGIYCPGGEAAARYAAMGFNFLAVGSDVSFLVEGSRAALKAARGHVGEGPAGY